VFYLFLLAISIQLFYWLVVFAPFTFRDKNNNSTVTAQQQPVSIIICAKNEAENLNKYLPFILSQRYTAFEVIVVDDNSTDNTKDVIEAFMSTSPQIKYVFLPAEEKVLPGKRSALLKGINAAANEWIVLTDADCRPKSNGWLRYITKPLFEGKELVIGYSPYKSSFSLLNAIIRYETFYTALQYFSFASIGMPYMAVGRNMAYTKSFFKKSKNFYKTENTVSGDDDLLVNELATKNNYGLVWNYHSQILSVPKKTYTEWFQQKIRHYEAGNQYKNKHKVILGALYISSLLSTISALILYTANFKIEVLFIMLTVKVLLQAIVAFKLLSRWKESGLLLWVLVFDFLFPMILFTLGTASIFYKQKIAWKKN
jgi:cellulose synthase/poly-beta-1,6-N-acetylglucosamine synthase-like glycosyltransferase